MQPFVGLTPGRYGAILADPPWAFRSWGGDDATPHRTETDHYRVQHTAWIANLPVGTLAARDCALFMWVIDSHLNVALAVGRAWGFDYKTRAFEWLKTGANGGYRIGMGYWTRKQTESCLLFTRGSPRRVGKGVRQIIEAPRREHSRKPDETYERIEALVEGPYCELFARRRRQGWDAWGDQVPDEDDL